MANWADFAKVAPELAAFGQARLAGKVAYIATTRADGSPRVHPLTPIIGEGHLFVFMEPTSPKGHDLRRDGRYALHCAVADNEGGEGEFAVSGRARLVENAELRAVAVRSANYTPKDRYILFELAVEAAFSTVYKDDEVIRQRWENK